MPSCSVPLQPHGGGGKRGRFICSSFGGRLPCLVVPTPDARSSLGRLLQPPLTGQPGQAFCFTIAHSVLQAAWASTGYPGTPRGVWSWAVLPCKFTLSQPWGPFHSRAGEGRISKAHLSHTHVQLRWSSHNTSGWPGRHLHWLCPGDQLVSFLRNWPFVLASGPHLWAFCHQVRNDTCMPSPWRGSSHPRPLGEQQAACSVLSFSGEARFSVLIEMVMLDVVWVLSTVGFWFWFSRDGNNAGPFNFFFRFNRWSF